MRMAMTAAGASGRLRLCAICAGDCKCRRVVSTARIRVAVAAAETFECRFTATPQRPSTPCSASARASDPPTTATSSDNAPDPGRPMLFPLRQPPSAPNRSTSIRAECRMPPACLTATRNQLRPSPKAPAHRPARVFSKNRAGNVEGRSTSGVTGSKGRSIFRDIRPPIPTTSAHLYRGIRPALTRCREALVFDISFLAFRHVVEGLSFGRIVRRVRAGRRCAPAGRGWHLRRWVHQ